MELVVVQLPDIDFTALSDDQLRDFIRDVAIKERSLVNYAHNAYMEDVRRGDVGRKAPVERKKYKLPKLTARTCAMCSRNLKPNEEVVCNGCLPS